MIGVVPVLGLARFVVLRILGKDVCVQGERNIAWENGHGEHVDDSVKNGKGDGNCSPGLSLVIENVNEYVAGKANRSMNMSEGVLRQQGAFFEPFSAGEKQYLAAIGS